MDKSVTSHPNRSVSLKDRERVIDRVFQRLHTMYGSAWDSKWALVPYEEVKKEWGARLIGFDLEAIRQALDHYAGNGGPHPPSLGEFVTTCKQFVRKGPSVFLLTDDQSAPKGAIDPDVKKLIDEAMAKAPAPNREWAHKVIALHKQGNYSSFMGLEMAKRALRMPNAIDNGEVQR